MLNEFPLEIVVNISLRLNICDKLSLMLTCKKLKDAIYQTSFFDTVKIINSKEVTESVLFGFRGNQAIGKRVKILQIELGHLSDELCYDIPLIYPNVEHFHDLFGDSVPRPEGTLGNFVKWKNTLKKLEPGYGRAFGPLYTLLENHVFPYLTDLHIGCSRDGKISPRIRECVNHAPSLVKLEVSYRTLTIEDIESIHQSSPQLTTFKIRSTVFSVSKEETLPQGMKAASNMTHLSIEDVSFIDENCVFLDYITQKYTKLIEFNFYPSSQVSSINLHFPKQTRAEQLANLEFNTIVKQACDTVSAYGDKGSSKLSNLAATIKKLTIDWFDLKNAMSIFTPKFSNLGHLDFFQYYGVIRDEFKQADSIDTLKNLTKLKSFSAVLEPSIHQYNHEGPLSTSIIHLNVCIKGKSSQNDMVIAWFFEMFPSMHRLFIPWSGARLIGYRDCRPRICHNLTTLHFGTIDAHPKLLQFIRDCAPNLKHLYWSIFDCFHLNVDLRDKHDNKKENIYLSLKKKGGVGMEIIALDDYSCIVPKNRTLFSKSAFSAKVKIKIKYNYTKMISIEPGVKIDLNCLTFTADYIWAC